MTVQKGFGWYDVLDDDASVADSTGDIGASINRIIARTPDLRSAGDSGFESHGTVRIVVSSRYPGAQPDYNCATPIEIPADKNIEIVSAGPHGPGIVNNTGGDHLVEFDDTSGVGAVFRMEGVTLIDGGANCDARRRGVTQFARMKFINTPAPAIWIRDDPNGFGPVTYNVDDCQFVRCTGDVWNQASTYLIGHLDRNRHISGRDVAVKLDGIGLDVLRSDFQSTDGPAYIQLPGVTDQNSLISIQGNRFGSETTNYAGTPVPTPTCDILLGNVDLTVNEPEQIGNVAMLGNRHMGGKDYAIMVNDNPRNLTIDGHSYFDASYNAAHIGEGWAGSAVTSPSTATSGQRLIRNYVGRVTIADPGDSITGSANNPPVKSLPFFEKGGIGWSAPNLFNSYADGESYDYRRITSANGTVYAESIDNTGARIVNVVA